MYPRAEAAARILCDHHNNRTRWVPTEPAPATRAEAYEIQDKFINLLGPLAGWKVGRTKAERAPYCAPIPVNRAIATGGRYGRIEGFALLEAELGFRIRKDIAPATRPATIEESIELIDAIVPAIEILEVRLDHSAAHDVLWKLADLQSNGGLVLGEAVGWSGQDLEQVELMLGSEKEAFAPAHHPFGRPAEMLHYAINHTADRGFPLREGSVVITGSYCGVVRIEDPRIFCANFQNFGQVSLVVE